MPEKLEKVLFETLERLQLRTRVEDGLVLTRWEEIVGTEISRHTRPRSLKGRTLFVEATSNVWAQELNFMKKKLLDELNTQLTTKIHNIYFQPQRTRPTPEPPQESFGLSELTNISLTPPESQQIRALTKQISDSKVRKKLTDLFILDKKFKRLQSERGKNSDRTG